MYGQPVITSFERLGADRFQLAKIQPETVYLGSSTTIEFMKGQPP
jgi:hypothetical protein